MTMGKKPQSPNDSAAGVGSWRRGRRLLAVVLTVAVVAGALAGLAWLGDEALRRIGSRVRYQARVQDVECEPPPGIERSTFLAEVRYVAELPETEAPSGVAQLLNVVAAPTAAAGQVWTDATVKRAVELVKAYRPKTLEKTRSAWKLVQADGTTLNVGE